MLSTAEIGQTGGWKTLADRYGPTITYGPYDIYLFPPFLNSTNDKNGYAVLFLAGQMNSEMFGNQAQVGLNHNGRWYSSVEHFFQSQKYMPHDPARANAVANLPSPAAAFEAGRDRAYPINPNWDSIRTGIMYQALTAKIRDNYLAMTALCELPAQLLEDPATAKSIHGAGDDFWGFGPNGQGQNILGKMFLDIKLKISGSTSLPYQLVRVKISSSSIGLAYPPPGGAPTPSLLSMSCPELGTIPNGYLGPILRLIFGSVTEAAKVCLVMAKVAPSSNDRSIFSLSVERSGQEAGHIDTFCLQCVSSQVAGKVNRSSLEQCCLEGLSIVKQCIMKDKMYSYLPSSAGGVRTIGSLFPVPPAASVLAPATTVSAPTTVASTSAHQTLAVPPYVLGPSAGFKNMKLMNAKDAVSIMGAAKIYSDQTENIMVQPKLDGVRILMYLDMNSPCGVSGVTRQGTLHPIVREFASEVGPILHALCRDLKGPIALDGELYVHGMPSGLLEHVSAPVKKTTAGPLTMSPYTGTITSTQLNKLNGALQSYGHGSASEAKNKPLVDILEFHVFGCVQLKDDGSDATSMPAWNRWGILDAYMASDSIGASHYVKAIESGVVTWKRQGPRVLRVPATFTTGNAGLAKFLDKLISLDYEGIMIYSANGAYQCGRRARELLKLKHTETEWFQISGIAPEAGGVPSANIKYIYGTGEYIASGFFDATMKGIIYHSGNKLVGKWAYIRFQKITIGASGGGALRDPKVLYISATKDGAPLDFALL